MPPHLPDNLGNSMNNEEYILALHSIDGLGSIRLKRIIDYFKDPKLAWEADLSEIQSLGIPRNVIELLSEVRRKLNPDEYKLSIQNANVKWMTVYDTNYPKSLKTIYDPPTVLYYKGDILPEDEKAIAVVGTRKITGYGKTVTEKFTRDLVAAGFAIVSGLAKGVDTTAHRQTIESGGRTLAILGGGLNRIFPPENIGLSEKIASGFGAVLSEFPPDNPSLPGNFPARNRIIAGLSQAVLVTEAALDSGSLITARLAAEQGREVFTVPGPVTSNLTHGPICLIREGAKVVFEAKDILDELGVPALKRNPIISKDFSEDEKRILQVLENESMHLDEIGRKLSFLPAKVSSLLLKMEILGVVKSMGAGIYTRL